MNPDSLAWSMYDQWKTTPPEYGEEDEDDLREMSGEQVEDPRDEDVPLAEGLPLR